MGTGRKQPSKVGQDRRSIAVASRSFERNSDVSARIPHSAVGAFWSSCAVAGKLADRDPNTETIRNNFWLQALELSQTFV
jgi:hypothetical protein